MCEAATRTAVYVSFQKRISSPRVQPRTSELPYFQRRIKTKQERLHAENVARATARRTREEAEARDRAAAAAVAADLAKQEAVGCLQRLQKQHEEQVSIAHSIPTVKPCQRSCPRQDFGKRRRF